MALKTFPTQPKNTQNVQQKQGWHEFNLHSNVTNIIKTKENYAILTGRRNKISVMIQL